MSLVDLQALIADQATRIAALEAQMTRLSQHLAQMTTRGTLPDPSPASPSAPSDTDPMFTSPSMAPASHCPLSSLTPPSTSVSAHPALKGAERKSEPARTSRTSRRRLLQQMGTVAAAAGAAGVVATVAPAVESGLTPPVLAAAQAASDAGSPDLTATETYADGSYVATIPPLDSPIIWSRGINTTNPQDNEHATHGLLSLITEVSSNATTSYPMPLYVQLTTAHSAGDATGINSTLFQQTPPKQSGWATAYHAEPHQQGDGTLIGVNVEANRDTNGTGRLIGVNVQATAGNGDEGINIQSSPTSPWQTGINFDTGSTGTRAIWIQGAWTVGLDLGDTHLRMNAGQHIALEPTEAVYIMYNPTSQRIEFYRNNVVVASF